MPENHDTVIPDRNTGIQRNSSLQDLTVTIEFSIKVRQMRSNHSDLLFLDEPKSDIIIKLGRRDKLYLQSVTTQ